MPRPIDHTEKIYCVEYRTGLGDGTLRRYICKASDPREAERMARMAVGRDIRIDRTPRVMERGAASYALSMYSGFTGTI